VNLGLLLTYMLVRLGFYKYMALIARPARQGAHDAALAGMPTPRSVALLVAWLGILGLPACGTLPARRHLLALR
jgi:hypothetical protein